MHTALEAGGGGQRQASFLKTFPPCFLRPWPRTHPAKLAGPLNPRGLPASVSPTMGLQVCFLPGFWGLDSRPHARVSALSERSHPPSLSRSHFYTDVLLDLTQIYSSLYPPLPLPALFISFLPSNGPSSGFISRMCVSIYMYKCIT